MQRPVILALATLLLCLHQPAEARGKGGSHHSSSHSSSHSTPHGNTHDSHASSGSGSMRSHRESERDTAAGGRESPSAAGNGGAPADDTKIQAQANATLAMREAQQADEARRREQAAEHARMAESARQRRDAEARAQTQENARQTRLAEVAAREAQCQIKGVMTDLEIATCRRVWAANTR